MQIVFHIGANATDGERLLKSLLKNAQTFADQGILVPGPGKYRKLLRETILSLAGEVPGPGSRDVLLETILDGSDATRLVMSHNAFLAVPNQIFDEGEFYANTDFKISTLAALFPDDELELHLAMRNPATFIPAVFEQSVIPGIARFMNGMDPMEVRWSDVVRRITEAAPQANVTVWCNEDTPLIWAQLIRELSGVDPLTRIVGGFDLLAAIMSEDGMRRFLTYLKTHPPQTESQKRKIIAAFLDKYALPEEVEEEVDVEGWDAAYVDALTEAYEADMDVVASLPGVTFVAP